MNTDNATVFIFTFIIKVTLFYLDIFLLQEAVYFL